MSFVKWKAQRRLYFPKECDCKCQDESGGPSERNCYTSPWVTLHESSPSSFTPTHDLYTILHLSSTPKSTVYIRLDQTLPQIWCPCICDKSQTTPLDEVQMKKRSPFLLKVPHPPFNHKSLTFFLTISEHYQTQRFLLFVLRCTSNFFICWRRCSLPVLISADSNFPLQQRSSGAEPSVSPAAVNI